MPRQAFARPCLLSSLVGRERILRVDLAFLVLSGAVAAEKPRAIRPEELVRRGLR